MAHGHASSRHHGLLRVQIVAHTSLFHWPKYVRLSNDAFKREEVDSSIISKDIVFLRQKLCSFMGQMGARTSFCLLKKIMFFGRLDSLLLMFFRFGPFPLFIFSYRLLLVR